MSDKAYIEAKQDWIRSYARQLAQIEKMHGKGWELEFAHDGDDSENLFLMKRKDVFMIVKSVYRFGKYIMYTMYSSDGKFFLGEDSG